MLVDFGLFWGGEGELSGFCTEAVTLARTLAHIYEGYNTLLVELHMPVKLKPSPWGDHPWVKNFFFQDGVDQELWNQMRWLGERFCLYRRRSRIARCSPQPTA